MEFSRREINKIKCRNKILKSSRRLFNLKGFENTTIEEIAQNAEISNATFYNYFPTKESLLIGASEDLYNLHTEYISKELANEKNSERKIRKAVEFMILDIKSFASLSRKMNYLNACSDSVLYNRMRMRDIIHSLVVEAQQIGDIKKDYSTDYITDIYMSIFYLAVYGWSDFENYSDEYCAEKINKYLDIVTSKIIVEDI